MGPARRLERRLRWVSRERDDKRGEMGPERRRRGRRSEVTWDEEGEQRMPRHEQGVAGEEEFQLERASKGSRRERRKAMRAEISVAEDGVVFDWSGDGGGGGGGLEKISSGRRRMKGNVRD